MDIYDGIICPSPYEIERIVFTGVTGDAAKDLLYIWQYDEANIDGMSEDDIANYLVKDNASELEF